MGTIGERLGGESGRDISPIQNVTDFGYAAPRFPQWMRQPEPAARKVAALAERLMQQLKNVPDFMDRQQAARAAKQAILEKFKPKPMIRAVEPINREAERAAKAEAIRAARAAEKAAKEQAKMMEVAAQVQAKIEAEADDDAAKRAERKARKAAMKEAARLKRESKQAARR